MLANPHCFALQHLLTSKDILSNGVMKSEHRNLRYVLYLALQDSRAIVLLQLDMAGTVHIFGNYA